MRPTKRAGLVLVLLRACSRESDVDGPVYLGDLESRQFSELAQIHRGNVAELDVAGFYRTGDADPDDCSQIQCNATVVDGVLYATSPKRKLFALDFPSSRANRHGPPSPFPRNLRRSRASG